MAKINNISKIGMTTNKYFKNIGNKNIWSTRNPVGVDLWILLRHFDGDGFHFSVSFQSIFTEFAPNSRHFVTTERSCCIENVVTVNPETSFWALLCLSLYHIKIIFEHLKLTRLFQLECYLQHVEPCRCLSWQHRPPNHILNCWPFPPNPPLSRILWCSSLDQRS